MNATINSSAHAIAAPSRVDPKVMEKLELLVDIPKNLQDLGH
jgi:hypothetical protein